MSCVRHVEKVDWYAVGLNDTRSNRINKLLLAVVSLIVEYQHARLHITILSGFLGDLVNKRL